MLGDTGLLDDVEVTTILVCSFRPGGKLEQKPALESESPDITTDWLCFGAVSIVGKELCCLESELFDL